MTVSLVTGAIALVVIVVMVIGSFVAGYFTGKIEGRRQAWFTKKPVRPDQMTNWIEP